MVEQVVQPTLNGRDNTRRTLRRAQTMTRRQADQGFIPGQLNPAACRCVADGESFILLDEAERIYFGSRSLIAAAFHSMTLRNVICDGRYKQIPAALRRGASSQFYSVIGLASLMKALLYLCCTPSSRMANGNHLSPPVCVSMANYCWAGSAEVTNRLHVPVRLRGSSYQCSHA